jgi:hypothetical protein
MGYEDFVLSWEDVLHMQLLLQYFDSVEGLSKVSHDAHLYVSLDPKTVTHLKEALVMGHVRGQEDGPKKTRPPPAPLDNLKSYDLTSGESKSSNGTSSSSSSTTPKSPKLKGTSKLPPPNRRPSETRSRSSSSNTTSLV